MKTSEEYAKAALADFDLDIRENDELFDAVESSIREAMNDILDELFVRVLEPERAMRIALKYKFGIVKPDGTTLMGEMTTDETMMVIIEEKLKALVDEMKDVRS